NIKAIEDYGDTDTLTHKCVYRKARELAETLKTLLKDNTTDVTATASSGPSVGGFDFSSGFGGGPGGRGFGGGPGGRGPGGFDGGGRGFDAGGRGFDAGGRGMGGFDGGLSGGRGMGASGA